MMKFFHTLLQSLTHKEFYASVIRKEKNMGYGFVFKLQIIASLFLTILLSINISTVLPAFDKIAHEVLPPGAEVIIKDGILDTNANPIVVAFPKKYTNTATTSSSSTTPVVSGTQNKKTTAISTSSATVSQEGEELDTKVKNERTIANIIVVDVTASTTPADLEKKSTLILVTAEGVIVKNASGSFSTSYFKSVKDLDVTIDEAWLVSKSDWVKGFAKFLPFIAFFFLLASLYLGSLLGALIYGFAAWLMFKLMGKPQPFKTSYSVGLYSRTFATILGLIAIIMPFFGSNLIIIPLELLFILLMIKDIRKSSILEAEIAKEEHVHHHK